MELLVFIWLLSIMIVTLANVADLWYIFINLHFIQHTEVIL